MIKYLKKIGFALLIFILGFGSVNASSNYTISLSSNNVSKGKSITLYIKGTNVTGGFVISSSDSTVASVSSTTSWVENNTQAITISTNKVGSANITDKPPSISDDNGNDLSLGTKTLTLNVNNGSSSSGNGGVTNKSNDATLKSLAIDGIDISPEFKSDVLEYKATAEAGTEKVKINATTNNSKATVSGAGEVSVSDGANKLEIVVTAEDGSIKTYVITLEVKDYDPITVKIKNKEYTVVRKESDLPEVDLFEKSKVEIGNEEVVGYYNDKLNIYLIGLKDDKGNISLYVYDTKKDSYVEYKWVTVGGVTLWLKDAPSKLENFTKYSITIKNTNTSIYKISKSDKVGLIYGTNVVTGNTSYYIYDKEEETLARYYDKEVDIYKNKISDYKNYLMLFMGIVSIIIIISVVISLIRGRKKKRKVNR